MREAAREAAKTTLDNTFRLVFVMVGSVGSSVAEAAAAPWMVMVGSPEGEEAAGSVGVGGLPPVFRGNGVMTSAGSVATLTK